VTGAAVHISAAGWQVLHITGTDRGSADPNVGGYHSLPYCDRMDLAFAAADLVLCRAGAATVTELAALGLPSVVVPYASGNGEQQLNARELVGAGGAVMVPDAELTPQWVATNLVALLGRRSEVASMALAAATVARRGGSAALLQLVREALAGSHGVG
jgi:UDP-N-acetylglucosamine--N-acetylmuramyl-(pentapeptide) pyrophosphoryl-undecaprenol N-acetylglucosamine transferase